jgi:predicted secreted hydrolase
MVPGQVNTVYEATFDLPSVLGERITGSITFIDIMGAVLEGDESGRLQQGHGDCETLLYLSNPIMRVVHGNVMNVDLKPKSYAWIDRQWSSSTLDRSLLGWNWFNILFDTYSVMVLEMLDINNKPMFQYGVGVDTDGIVTKSSSWSKKVSRVWISPLTLKEYITEISITFLNKTYFLKSTFDDQEENWVISSLYHGFYTANNNGRGFSEQFRR